MIESPADIHFPGLKPAATDSFSACLAAVADYWKRDFDYTFMAGATGSAFSPGWQVGEDCVAWWMEVGLPQRLDFVGRTVGFFVNESPDMSHEDYKSKGGVSDEILEFRKLARDAVAGGEIVLVWSWPMWGIIKSWDDDVTKIELATLPGPAASRTRVFPLSKMYILNPGPPELTIYEALRQTLIYGAGVANGDVDVDRFRYGGSLYKAMLEKAGDEIYCKPCGSRSWTCVLRTMWRVSGINKTCSEFLEFAGMFLGEIIPKEELELAIDLYGQISKTAGKYLDENTMREKWGKTEFREQYTADVKKMRELHRECAKAMRVLAASAAS